jgi:hypothetical protein
MVVRLKTETIAVRCPHCGKEYEVEVAPKPDKMGECNIECPECKKLWMKPLPGEIVSGPTPKERLTQRAGREGKRDEQTSALESFNMPTSSE